MSFSKQEKSFLSVASTSVVIPQKTGVSLSEVFQEHETDPTLQDIRQRDVLFFDEKLTAYVVLHVPQCPEDELKSYLSRLDLKIEVWATSSSQGAERSPGSGPARDLVFSETVSHTEDPIVLISQKEGDEKIFINLLWEVMVTVNRPRLRLYDVHVAFIPVALISPQQTSVPDEVYLEPFQPQVGNLFEPLRGSRGFGNQIPYLPVSRLSSVLPLPPKDDNRFHLRSVPSRSIPTHLAFATKLKYSRASVDDLSPSVIASLDIDVVPFVDIQGLIEVADAELQQGKATSFMTDMLPIDCQSKDCVTLLYRLEHCAGHSKGVQYGINTYIDMLTLTIKVKVKLPGDCEATIDMLWTTNIDFSLSANRAPFESGTDSHRHSSTPQIPVDTRVPNPSQTIGMSLQQGHRVGALNTLTISFAATVEPIRVGVPFTWQVLIVNGTARPAKLAIIPLPRIQKPTTQAQQYAKRHATKSSITSLHPSEKAAGEKEQSEIAEAMMDENVIYAMQHSSAVPAETDLMSLTSELRVGPLGPGQCYEGEIKLVAFKTGAFTLDAIRVVDLVKEVEQGYGNAGVIVDVRELPDVIVDVGPP